MAKTYTTAGSAVAGDVYTASAHNVIVTDVNNLIVPPLARLRLTSDVSVPNVSHTNVGFTSSNAVEDYDTDGLISLSASASSMTIQTAGIYLFAVSIDFAVNTSGARYSRIVRNRSGTRVAISANMLFPTGNEFHNSCSGMIECNVSDVIELWVFQSSGGALNLQAADGSGIQYGGTWMTAAWMGRTA